MIRKRLHHVGIIMPSMESMEAFMKQYGLEEDYRAYVAPYHAHAIFTKPKINESPIEFLVPSEGVLAEFNNGKGGIHHICYEVDNVEAASKEFRDSGILMLEDVCPQVDVTSKINFVRPKYSQGILVELWEVTEPTDNYLK